MIKIIWLTTSPKIRYKRQKYKFNRKIMGNRELIQGIQYPFFSPKNKNREIKGKTSNHSPTILVLFYHVNI